MTDRTKTYGTKGQLIHAQTREIIARVIAFMKKEAEFYQRTRQVLIPLNNYKQRVLAATRISTFTYRKVMKEAAKITCGDVSSIKTPKNENKDIETIENVEQSRLNTIFYYLNNF